MNKIISVIIACNIYFNLSAQNVGIGILTPAQKLDVAGNIKLSGVLMPGGVAGTAGQLLVSNGSVATPTWQSTIAVSDLQLTGNGAGLNKVITSDALGNASWKGPVAFTVHEAINVSHSNNQEAGVSFTSEDFDEGNIFSTGRFTAPQNGIYHFDVGVKWGNQTVSNYTQTVLQKCDLTGANCVILASSKINNQDSPQQTIGVNAKLVTGDRVRVLVFHTNTSSQARVTEGIDANGNLSTFFSGNLLR